MTVALFSLIAWITIIVFSLIRKSLSKIRNVILFFCFSIIIINLFTILTLNMEVIKNANEPELYFCILLQRSIIMPLSLLTYVNMSNSQKKTRRILASVCTFVALFFIEMLLKWLNIKIYVSWSVLATIITIVLLIIISNLLTKLLDMASRRYG